MSAPAPSHTFVGDHYGKNASENWKHRKSESFIFHSATQRNLTHISTHSWSPDARRLHSLPAQHYATRILAASCSFETAKMMTEELAKVFVFCIIQRNLYSVLLPLLLLLPLISFRRSIKNFFICSSNAVAVGWQGVARREFRTLHYLLRKLSSYFEQINANDGGSSGVEFSCTFIIL